MTGGWSMGLAVVLAFALSSCGGTDAQHYPQRRQQIAGRVMPPASATHRPLARSASAQPVRLTGTPSALLAVCLKNSLLRPICPRLGPVANAPHTSIRRLGFCYDRAGHDLLLNGHYRRLASGRCVDADWGYEAVRDGHRGSPPASRSPYVAGTR